MTLEVFEQHLTQLESKHEADISQLTSTLAALMEQNRQQGVALAALTTQVSNIVAVIAAVEGAFKVLEFIGKAAKPVAWMIAIGAALVAIYDNATGRTH